MATFEWKNGEPDRATEEAVARTNERQARRDKGLCPSCGKVALTKNERRHGYQCPDCTARDEGMGY